MSTPSQQQLRQKSIHQLQELLGEINTAQIYGVVADEDTDASRALVTRILQQKKKKKKSRNKK